MQVPESMKRISSRERNSCQGLRTNEQRSLAQSTQEMDVGAPGPNSEEIRSMFMRPGAYVIQTSPLQAIILAR